MDSILEGGGKDSSLIDDETEQKPECSKTQNVLINKPVIEILKSIKS